MSAVVARFVYTEDVALRANREVIRASFPWISFLPLIGAMMTALLVYGWLAKGVAPWASFNPLIFGPFFCAVPFFSRREARKRFRANPNAGHEITWRVDRDRLSNETEGEKSSFEWRKLIRVKEVKDGFLLFPQPKLAFWLPKTGFASEDDLRLFRAFVRESGIKQQG